MNILKFRKVFYFIYLIHLIYLITPLTVAAKQIYECNDSKGNKLYTDHPNSDPNCLNPVQKKVEPARTINLKNGASVKTVEPSKSQETQPSKSESESESESTSASGVSLTNNINNTDNTSNNQYNSIHITSPANNEAVNSCGGQYSIQFTTEPSLKTNNKARLLIDGVVNNETATGNSIDTNTLERGTHSATIQIINTNNEIIQTSEPVNFMFMRNCARQ